MDYVYVKKMLVTAVAAGSIIIAGCGGTHGGHYAQPGFSDGEAEIGQIVFTYDSAAQTYSPYHSSKIQRIVSLNGPVIECGTGEHFTRGEVVVPGRITPGTLVMLRRLDCSEKWSLVKSVDTGAGALTASCSGKSVTEPFDRIELPTAARLRRLLANIARGAALLGLSIAAFLISARGRRRAESDPALLHAGGHRAAARAAALDGGAPAREIELLACPSCGFPVPLADVPAIACRSCGTSVPMPETYRELARTRGELESTTAREARVLRLYRVFTHPLLVIVFLAVAIGGILIVVRAPDSPTIIILRMPLAAAAFGFFFSAVGQLTGGRRLRQHLPGLYAVRGAKGLECRACGAPLRMERGSFAEVCGYCGAQNLLSRGARAAIKQGRVTIEAAARTMGVAIAETRLALWTAAGYPIFYGSFFGGLFGLLVLSIALVAYWIR